VQRCGAEASRGSHTSAFMISLLSVKVSTTAPSPGTSCSRHLVSFSPCSLAVSLRCGRLLVSASTSFCSPLYRLAGVACGATSLRIAFTRE
jgi:hypothetical protein